MTGSQMVSNGQTDGLPGSEPAGVSVTANDLYWNSSVSVNRLADRLDLSKGALYELLTPFPAGIPCPKGDGEMGYSNRTAREKGVLSCSGCGFEDLEEVILSHYEKLGLSSELGGDPPSDTLRPPRLHVQGSGEAGSPVQRSPRSLEKLLLGSALVGVAVGLAVSTLFRRR